MKTLVILDLDHTLIYGSYTSLNGIDLLFKYNEYLQIYKRPMANDLLAYLKGKADIIVYSTALRNYVTRICEHLQIQPNEILSRRNCKMIKGVYHKKLKDSWLKEYNHIIIIDDSPQIWITQHPKVQFLVPTDYMGNINDQGLGVVLLSIKEQLK